MEKDIERFKKYMSPRPDGCILWTGKVCKAGYGVFRFYSGGRREVRATRFSLANLGSGLPTGLMALHRCDHRLCVNPVHLYAGTAEDNMRDSQERTWRTHPELRPHGEDCTLSKVTEEQVREIFYSGGSYADTAAKFGLSVGAVSSIKSGKSWRHLRLGRRTSTDLKRMEIAKELRKAEGEVSRLREYLNELNKKCGL